MIPYGRHHLEDDDVQAVVEVLRGRPLTQGPKVAEFEAALAEKVGAKYAVAVSSGTAALHLACLAAGMKAGEAVLTSPITFVASANGGLYCGGVPSFADIDPDTINVDPSAVAAACQAAKPRVVVPVHFAGLPCDMPAIERAARKTGSIVVEDAAHALGGRYPDGRPVGCCANSDMTIFSFHPVKAIAAGEGGAVTTNDPELARRLRNLRSHGIVKGETSYQSPDDARSGGKPNPWYYEMQELGYHYRITDIQCALAISQLKKLDGFVEKRRRLAKRYDALLAGVPHLSPIQRAGRDLSAHHIYVVRIDFKAVGRSRREVMESLAKDGVGSQVHYIPVHRQPYYRRFGFKPGSFPRAERYYEEALTIPLYVDLSEADQDRVVEALRRAARPVSPGPR